MRRSLVNLRNLTLMAALSAACFSCEDKSDNPLSESDKDGGKPLEIPFTLDAETNSINAQFKEGDKILLVESKNGSDAAYGVHKEHSFVYKGLVDEDDKTKAVFVADDIDFVALDTATRYLQAFYVNADMTQNLDISNGETPLDALLKSVKNVEYDCDGNITQIADAKLFSTSLVDTTGFMTDGLNLKYTVLPKFKITIKGKDGLTPPSRVVLKTNEKSLSIDDVTNIAIENAEWKNNAITVAASSIVPMLSSEYSIRVSSEGNVTDSVYIRKPHKYVEAVALDYKTDEILQGTKLTPGLVPTNIDILLASGDGTKAKPYRITNANDFRAFIDYVNGPNTNNKFKGKTAGGIISEYKYIKLETSIEVDESFEWVPIQYDPSNNNLMAFDFDGGGHTISGKIKCVAPATTPLSYCGIFGRAQFGKIHDLNVEADFTVGEYKYFGSIIGHAQNLLPIENCTFKGNIDSKAYITGGLAGFHSCDMSNCSVSGNIKSTPAGFYFENATKNVYTALGGLVGEYGVTGIAESVTCKSNVLTESSVTANGFVTNVGGLVAKIAGSKPVIITDCNYNGDINPGTISVAPTGKMTCGGLIGVSVNNTNNECSNLKFNGNLKGFNISEGVTLTAQISYGGIIGDNSKQTFKGCTVKGTMNKTTGNTTGNGTKIKEGRIAGQNTGGIFTDCNANGLSGETPTDDYGSGSASPSTTAN